MLKTRICELFGIDYPIISAGMGGVAFAELRSKTVEEWERLEQLTRQDEDGKGTSQPVSGPQALRQRCIEDRKEPHEFIFP